MGWVGWGLRGGRAPGLVQWVWGHLKSFWAWYPEENKHGAWGGVCRPPGLLEDLGSQGAPLGRAGEPGEQVVWGAGCGCGDAVSRPALEH